MVLKDAPILVLDEATSALDSEVELAIQEQLLGLMEGKTVIAIAHRLSTIARMDRLIVLDEGRIVEQGTHAQLIALGGHYATLWAHQSGGFLAEDVAGPGVPAVPVAARIGERTDALTPLLLDAGPVDDMRTAERAEPDVDAEPAPARN